MVAITRIIAGEEHPYGLFHLTHTPLDVLRKKGLRANALAEYGVFVLFVSNLAVFFVFSFQNKSLQIVDSAGGHPFDAKSGAFTLPGTQRASAEPLHDPAMRRHGAASRSISR
ncbi:hypothetical protein F6X40_39560 [Paraburkholderia sp. UCT31]|uniref:hypothetical protein n=1 Tax=Paraburkholderia sp. UCT31 TaxID=2615209 RepID=UPI001654D823|nr:hypothetical protein [Paraburkholderia sp. UCT31]MBC8742591.1 hypothetical protein [Paraburkholderia sp. UCT31]